MKTLKFDKKYYLAILNGDKTQTLRRNNKRLNQGEIVKAYFPGTEFSCKLRITETGYKQFKYVDEEDAEREGYDSLNELKEELMRFYPRLDKFDRLYYYRFKIV